MKLQHLKYILLVSVFLTVCSCEKERMGDEPDFEPMIEMKTVTDSSVVVRVYVNEGAELLHYYCSVMPVADYDTAGGDEAALAQGEQFIPELRRDLLQGSQNIEMTGLSPETEYYVYVYQLSPEGEAGRNVVKERFETPEREYTAFDASIDIYAVRHILLGMSIEVYDKSENFSVLSMTKSEFEEGSKDIHFMQKYFDDFVEKSVDPDKGIDRDAVLSSIIISGGSADGSISYLTPDTEYVIAVLRVTVDGTVTGFITETARTNPMVYGEGTVNFEYGKYYDGAYLGYPGNAAVPIDVMVEGNAQSWIFSTRRADYMSEEEMPDYTVHAMLVGDANSLKNILYVVYFLPWDTDITLMGFTLDSDMNLGKVTREKMYFTKDGVSDIRDYLVPEEALCVSPVYEEDEPMQRPVFIVKN